MTALRRWGGRCVKRDVGRRECNETYLLRGVPYAAVTISLFRSDLPAGLADDLCAAGGRLAVDTETGGLDWSTSRLHLCQLYSPTSGSILVRDVTSRPENLARVLESESILKVLHFAPFDLRFLRVGWGIDTTNVACTKAASKLLRPELPAEEHSLKNLLFRVLGVVVTKGEVRTGDWGAPELSPEQVAYAVGDVMHLLDLYEVLFKELRASGSEDLFKSVCRYMPVDAHMAVSGIPDPLRY